MTHPYAGLADQNFWKKFVADQPWRDLQLNGNPRFRLGPDDKVATAGSCFAQHIARYMRRVGMTPYIAEPAHPLLAEFGGDVDSYTQFSARYGNIYTSRQCLEMCLQAFGRMPMVEDFVEQDGHWYDLLRPNVQKGGYSSLAEARADRVYHLACVRTMFETADVFIFTLGLTECWYNARHGHTYPACPGTVRGTYEPQLHLFRNLEYGDILEDMERLAALLAEVNPALKLILTVSPVPLVATYTAQNVLVASSYSKSVLRAVAGAMELRHPQLAYFPSYEIISHAASFGQYLASDLREVTERGVSHVMGCFLSTFYGAQAAPVQAVRDVAAPAVERSVAAPLPECEELYNQAP